jgi:dihydroorotase
MDYILEGNVYLHGKGLTHCCIGIEEGKITKIKKILKGERYKNVGRNLILPAGIDCHVHFRDPGLTHKEDFATGTISAAFGGISCVLDMPNTLPPVVNSNTFMDKLKEVQKKAYVDFGLFLGVGQKTDLDSLLNHGRIFKIYTASTTGDMLIDDINTIKKILQNIGEKSGLAAIHCEDETILKQSSSPANSLQDHLISRPNFAETSAIEKILPYAVKVKIHICHITAKESIPLLIDSPLTSEVSPSHLFLNCKKDLGTFGKVNPPLRNSSDQSALLDALARGHIDIVASDHAPHTLEEKDQEFPYAPSGIPGVETLVPLTLSLVNKKLLSLDRWVDAVCRKPAEIFGMNKGVISKGYDADLIVVDMKKERKIREDELHSKCGWTPFNGFPGIFPQMTFLRGSCIVDNGELIGKIGMGSYIQCGYKTPHSTSNTLTS